MRTCSRMRFEQEPVATVALRYQAWEVVVGDLAPDRDPSSLDLCRAHVDGLTPPRGWSVRDERGARVP